jgi:hypothetical protein
MYTAKPVVAIHAKHTDTYSHAHPHLDPHNSKRRTGRGREELVVGKVKEAEEEDSRSITALRPHPPLVIQQTGITIPGNGSRDPTTLNHQNSLVC